jgi:hypothetical protein
MARMMGPRFVLGSRDECLSKKLVPCLTTGVLMGVTEAIFALSVGSLIFSGDLAPLLAYGIGMALVTSTLMLVVISLGSSTPGATGILQDSPSVILAVITTSLVGALPTARMEDKLATVLVAIACTALLTGLFFLALGFLSWGDLSAFCPIRSWVASWPGQAGYWCGVLLVSWLVLRSRWRIFPGCSNRMP